MLNIGQNKINDYYLLFVLVDLFMGLNPLLILSLLIYTAIEMIIDGYNSIKLRKMILIVESGFKLISRGYVGGSSFLVLELELEPVFERVAHVDVDPDVDVDVDPIVDVDPDVDLAP